MDAYTVAVGLAESLMALAGVPLMMSRDARRMQAGALLAVPFVVYMAVMTFAR